MISKQALADEEKQLVASMIESERLYQERDNPRGKDVCASCLSGELYRLACVRLLSRDDVEEWRTCLSEALKWNRCFFDMTIQVCTRSYPDKDSIERKAIAGRLSDGSMLICFVLAAGTLDEATFHDVCVWSDYTETGKHCLQLGRQYDEAFVRMTRHLVLGRHDMLRKELESVNKIAKRGGRGNHWTDLAPREWLCLLRNVFSDQGDYAAYKKTLSQVCNTYERKIAALGDCDYVLLINGVVLAFERLAARYRGWEPTCIGRPYVPEALFAGRGI